MNKTLLTTATLFALFVTGQAAAEGDPQAGQAKSAVCAACHGPDGNSFNPEWPRLAGQHAEYLVRQLEAFRSGARVNPLMTPVVANLSDQDIADLAAFYAAQTPGVGQADPQLVAKGERLYRGGNRDTALAACIACHGPAGRGNGPAGFPAIAGQHAAYVIAQLNAYKHGQRKTDPNQMMRNVAAQMSDDEIRAVASYLQGLH